MADYVQVMVTKAREHLEDVRRLYERDLESQVLSDDLLYAIRGVVSDCQSALDSTATRVKDRYGKSDKWKPYFPLSTTNRTDFDARLNKEIKGLSISHPNIAAAFERHQPYNAGKAELGYLHKLRRENVHAGDFTAQTRDEQRQWRQGSISWTDGISWTGGIYVGVGNTMRPMGDPATTTVTRIAQWLFVDPPVAVLPTLEALVNQVDDAVRDIHYEAAL